MISAARGLTIPLSFLAITLCCFIGTEVWNFHWRDASNPVAAPVVAETRPAPMDAVAAPDRHEAWLDEILARPLFSPNRRGNEAQTGPLPRLTGIVVAGSQQLAIFAGSTNGHPIIARAGARIGAYEVQTITEAGVSLIGPEGTTLIRPTFDSGGQSVAAVSRTAPMLPRPAAR